jgi:phosphoglycolate phosphatase
MNRIKGIIFDMDNTLLRSNIDFTTMKHETFCFLTSRGILSNEMNLEDHTTSTLIGEAMQNKLMTDELLREMWEIPKLHELAGMVDADLEPGVVELLHELKLRKYCVTIVTNNAIEAAYTALRRNAILDYFDCIVGREMMKTLKPSPDGYLYILNVYDNFTSDEWISVGDAWVDGKGSSAAGINFISYQGDAQKMTQMGVFPIAEITDIRELLLYL